MTLAVMNSYQTKSSGLEQVLNTMFKESMTINNLMLSIQAQKNNNNPRSAISFSAHFSDIKKKSIKKEIDFDYIRIRKEMLTANPFIEIDNRGIIINFFDSSARTSITRIFSLSSEFGYKTLMMKKGFYFTVKPDRLKNAVEMKKQQLVFQNQMKDISINLVDCLKHQSNKSIISLLVSKQIKCICQEQKDQGVAINRDGKSVRITSQKSWIGDKVGF